MSVIQRYGLVLTLSANLSALDSSFLRLCGLCYIGMHGYPVRLMDIAEVLLKAIAISDRRFT